MDEPTPSSTPEGANWIGDLPEDGVALLTFSGGTVPQMVEAAQASRIRTVFTTSGGTFVGYVLDAPAFVNADFESLFAGGIPPGTPFVVLAGLEQPPFSASDLARELARRGYATESTGEVRNCSGTDIVPGVRYEVDGGAFYLWTYPDAQSVAADWHRPYNFSAQHRTFECNYPPSRIFTNDNLVLVLRSEDLSDASWQAGTAVLQLGRAAPLPTDINQFAIADPALGFPFGGADLMAALAADGLTYIPYEQPGCPADSGGTRQAYGGPLPGEGPTDAGFTLFVYPTIAALEAEWELGEDGTLGEQGVHVHRDPQCDYSDGSIYRHQNLLLLLAGGVWRDNPEFRARVVQTFNALTP